jgi:hypothetical protein
MGTTSSRKRRHWPGWPTPTLRPSRARASNHSWIWSATVAGAPANGVGFGEEMNSTVSRSVKLLSFASRAIFSAPVRKPRSA